MYNNRSSNNGSSPNGIDPTGGRIYGDYSTTSAFSNRNSDVGLSTPMDRGLQLSNSDRQVSTSSANSNRSKSSSKSRSKSSSKRKGNSITRSYSRRKKVKKPQYPPLDEAKQAFIEVFRSTERLAYSLPDVPDLRLVAEEQTLPPDTISIAMEYQEYNQQCHVILSGEFEGHGLAPYYMTSTELDVSLDEPTIARIQGRIEDDGNLFPLASHTGVMASHTGAIVISEWLNVVRYYETAHLTLHVEPAPLTDSQTRDTVSLSLVVPDTDTAKRIFSQLYLYLSASSNPSTSTSHASDVSAPKDLGLRFDVVLMSAAASGNGIMETVIPFDEWLERVRIEGATKNASGGKKKKHPVRPVFSPDFVKHYESTYWQPGHNDRIAIGSRKQAVVPEYDNQYSYNRNSTGRGRQSAEQTANSSIERSDRLPMRGSNINGNRVSNAEMHQQYLSAIRHPDMDLEAYRKAWQPSEYLDSPQRKVVENKLRLKQESRFDTQVKSIEHPARRQVFG